MFWKTAPVAIAITVLAGPFALAQTSLSPLSLAAAQEIAVRSNPEISAAKREAEAAEGALIQAGARPNPVLGYNVEDQRRESRTTAVTISQTLELGGKRGARLAAAEQSLLISRAQVEAKLIEVRANVTAAFFASLIAQDRVRLAEATLSLATQGTDIAGKRVLAGKVSPVEETRARVAEAGARVELSQARGEQQTALIQLQTAIGNNTPITALDGNALNLPASISQEAISMRLANAPAIREARLEFRRLGALAELEAAKRTPDVTLSIGSQRAAELGRNQLLIGISVPLPVFDTNRGNLLEALRRRDKAEDLLVAAELRVRSDADIARQKQIVASSEVEALRNEVLPNAQIAFDAASKGYELGKFGYLDVLDAQRTLQQARAQFLRALVEAHRAASEIDRILGPSDNTIATVGEGSK